MSNYSPQPVRDAALQWSLNEDDEALLTGELTRLNAPNYEVTTLGSLQLSVPHRKQARKLTLHVSLPALGIRNRWDMWFFPPVTHELRRRDAVRASVAHSQTN